MSKRSENPADPVFQTMSHSGHQLPGLWRYMLPEDFMWMRLPEEREAVCSDCPMVLTHAYREECRCCTYFPHLPNYMLGLGLKHPGTRDRMMALIRSGHALPEGTLITPGRLETASALYSTEQFGRARDLTCPLIDPDTGECGIYPFRNSICATFFCKADHGPDGAAFWDEVQGFVGQVETALAHFAMTRAGLDAGDYIDTLDRLHTEIPALTEPETGAWSLRARGDLFQGWLGNEPTFFEACADAILAHRDNLYEIACRQTLRVAFDYERAVEKRLPAAQLAEIQALPENPGEPVRIPNLWYRVQLLHRRLWELPYNESPVILHPDARFHENTLADPLAERQASKPRCVTAPGASPDDPRQRLFLSGDQAAILELFRAPQIIGEALLERPELARLPDAKGFLAECMRRDILRTADATPPRRP